MGIPAVNMTYNVTSSLKASVMCAVVITYYINESFFFKSKLEKKNVELKYLK